MKSLELVIEKATYPADERVETLTGIARQIRRDQPNSVRLPKRFNIPVIIERAKVPSTLATLYHAPNGDDWGALSLKIKANETLWQAAWRINEFYADHDTQAVIAALAKRLAGQAVSEEDWTEGEPKGWIKFKFTPRQDSWIDFLKRGGMDLEFQLGDEFSYCFAGGLHTELTSEELEHAAQILGEEALRGMSPQGNA